VQRYSQDARESRAMIAKRCVACLTAFLPARPSHALCRRCWSWVSAARHVRLLARRLREAEVRS
ncbi:MAG TPA: hypothetical protein VGL96_06085, partial [Casimicrobiaceae bacterium]